MITVQEVYSQVCFALLENNGLTLGLVSEADFLHILGVVTLDFSQRAALDKKIYTQRIVSGQSQYHVPDDVMEPELAFVGGRLIEKVSLADLDGSNFQWRGKTGIPRQWHEDGLEVKHIEVVPKPDYSGTAGAASYGDWHPEDRNLTVVGPAALEKTTWVLADNLTGFPDSFCHYLVYGVLEKIFSAEGETRDAQRALYCRTRYEEGIALALAIGREELMEVDEG